MSCRWFAAALPTTAARCRRISKSGAEKTGQDALAALRPVLEELAGKSARAIAEELNNRGVATPAGGRWHALTVIRVQRRLEAVS